MKAEIINNDMYKIHLVCWHCGASKSTDVHQLPQYAIEVAAIANSLGMHGALDLDRGRTLVFCNTEHANMQRLKNGMFRLCPKKN